MAGGRGLRMGAQVPKQFLLLGGRPILMYTLERFAHCEQIVLALPQDQIAYWTELCRVYDFTLEHRVCSGGETRYHSVLNALAELPSSQGLVAVHDGVRPFVAPDVVERCYQEAEACGAALPYTPITDSLRLCSADGSRAVRRSDYVAVQRPQVFDLGQLRAAYALGYQDAFTDDASVYEAASLGELRLVEGNVENIKITSQQDLATAHYILSIYK